jgi:hypothetical protein
MAIDGIGELLGADEGLNHQTIDTFATISQTDLAWTEKIWASMAKTDGSLQVNLGLGKYQNRGIIDGFGGVARGYEQWTVRGSRELHSAPEDMSIGPIRYEIIDPLSTVRFILEPNDVQPISFDLVLTGVTQPFFEDRNLIRNKTTGRIDVDVIRYHQGGWATGEVTVDGTTHQFTRENSFGFRDHSWGVRQAVGAAPPDLLRPPRKPRAEGEKRPEFRGGMKWSPCFFERPDGSFYETAIHLTQGVWDYTSAYINESDGRQHRVLEAKPLIDYDPRTRFVRGGELHLTMESGEERVIEIEALDNSGFHLKVVGYGEWKGHMHGTWRGPLHFDGEYIDDCSSDEFLPQLGQLRDTPIRVREGDAVGYGIMESIVAGVWPELGLTAESDHRVAYS